MSWKKFHGPWSRQGSALPREHGEAGHEPESECTCVKTDMPLITDVAVDQKEVIALGLLREAFAGFCTGSVHHWNCAFDSSGELMGEDGGAVFFAHVLALARAIKSDRIGTFFFQPTPCGRITDEEALVLVMLQAARRNDLLALSNHAERMAQGGAPSRIRHAAFRLGALIEAATGSQPPARRPPAIVEHSATLH